VPADDVKFPLLELLPTPKKSAVLDQLRMQKYGRGEMVYERAGDCKDVFFICDGRVRIDTHDPHGEVAYYHARGPGEMIGYYSAITGKPQAVTATAVRASRLGRLPASEFMELLLAHPEMAHYMLQLVTEMLVSETKRIAHLITLPALPRVAAELLERAEVMGAVVEVPERVELAARLGMTRPTLAKRLSELRRRGIIRIEGNKIHVLDAKQLAELVEGF
jgi:CRP/FNR family transcriptional regulator, cyclic AMP receptor protein